MNASLQTQAVMLQYVLNCMFSSKTQDTPVVKEPTTQMLAQEVKNQDASLVKESTAQMLAQAVKTSGMRGVMFMNVYVI